MMRSPLRSSSLSILKGVPAIAPLKTTQTRTISFIEEESGNRAGIRWEKPPHSAGGLPAKRKYVGPGPDLLKTLYISADGHGMAGEDDNQED